MDQKKAVSLSEARDKIDEIDGEIHQLLMRRAELVKNIQTAKQQMAPLVNAMHADREIEMFRRFSKNHKGILPIASLQRMFREMIATFSHLQCPFKVFILKSDPLYRDVARYFYGTVIEIEEFEDAKSLIDAVVEPTSNVILLPTNVEMLDILSEVQAQSELAIEDKLHVFARLPFWNDGDAYGLNLPDMLVVGHAPMKPSGNDRTMVKFNSGLAEVSACLKAQEVEFETLFDHENQTYVSLKIHAHTQKDAFDALTNKCKADQLELQTLGIYGKL